MTVQLASGELATQILGDPRFVVSPYAARHARLGERLGLDFSAILFTLDHVPLAMNGEDHARQRADVARFLAERRGAVDQLIPVLAARAAAVLGQPGTHDLIGGLILPMVHDLIGTIVGLPLELAADSLTSRIFSQNIGIAQRRRLQAELTDLRARFKAAFPLDDDLRLGTRLAMIVLGRDALIGTLGQSLVHFLREAQGQPLSSVDMAVPPSHTGVPYIDRQAICPMHLGGMDMAAEETLRCDLASLNGGTRAERLRFFGAGMHLCLGRALTLDLFGALAAALKALPVRAEVLAYELRDDDVFHFPARFEVRISNG
jgi:cytochrome P450